MSHAVLPYIQRKITNTFDMGARILQVFFSCDMGLRLEHVVKGGTGGEGQPGRALDDAL